MTATPSTFPFPSTSVTTEFQVNFIFGSSKASSFRAAHALSSLPLWITWTDDARLVRNVASSIAVSPPPTTATFLPLKKNPSQTAQFETPFPMSRISESRLRRLGVAPVATMTESARTVAPLDVCSSNGYSWKFDLDDVLLDHPRPQPLGLALHPVHELRAHHRVREARDSSPRRW